MFSGRSGNLSAFIYIVYALPQQQLLWGTCLHRTVNMSQLWDPPQSELEKGVYGIGLDDVSVDTIATSTRYVFTEGPITEPVVPPIYHSSTYRLKNVDEYLEILQKGGYIYSRYNTFNSDSVQCAINALERGAGTLVFNTGMSAISTAMFALMRPGDHMVICDPCYAGAYDMARKIFPEFKIEVSTVPAGCSVEEYEKCIKPNTKLLYGETPCNPSMAILDLEAFGKLGQSRGILTMVDGTFAGPYNQQAIKHGVDISMQSCTKYLGGHSDLTAGSLTFRKKELWQKMIRYQTTFGSGLSAQDASLLLRGIKSLHVRMERHNSSALKIAEHLEKHSKINKVTYPGLPSHPSHEVAKKQMRGFSGMMTVDVKGGVKGGRILAENVKLIQLAVSLGGVESLIEHPASMTHGPMLLSDEDRRSSGISDGLVRISIGLEDPNDLIRDLDQALTKIPDELVKTG